MKNKENNTILLASGNAGKLIEMQALLKETPYQLITSKEMGIHLDIVEDGDTYAENAIKKALAYATASHMLVMADDSGLEVDALNGGPGLYSARFAPQPGATDADRRVYLLEQLQGHAQPWTARFRCVIAIAKPDGEVRTVEGICPGEILPEERGIQGFGYDPLFFIPEIQKTMAQMSMQEKNTLSHRARAVMFAIPLIEKMIH
ncbi:MAG: RdgB/HAM1 family non-canonical purine NTP pyrophosphatase [Anaerolineaceae bacterium]|nr:RdgB/HAM1 family non-canonical purine NTP pyrophosphatase [Anaerolineaceae bacterium]